MAWRRYENPYFYLHVELATIPIRWTRCQLEMEMCFDCRWAFAPLSCNFTSIKAVEPLANLSSATVQSVAIMAKCALVHVAIIVTPH